MMLLAGLVGLGSVVFGCIYFQNGRSGTHRIVNYWVFYWLLESLSDEKNLLWIQTDCMFFSKLLCKIPKHFEPVDDRGPSSPPRTKPRTKHSSTRETNPTSSNSSLNLTKIFPPPMGACCHRHISVVSSPSGAFLFFHHRFSTWVITPLLEPDVSSGLNHSM